MKHGPLVPDRSVHCAACMAGDVQGGGGQGRSFLRVPGTHSPAETNSDSNVE